MAPMDARLRDSYIELLEQGLTRGFAVGAKRGRSHRRRGSALLMQILGKRGFTIVPSIPFTDAVAVDRVGRLPGSRHLIKVLARRRFRVVPDDLGRGDFVWNGRRRFRGWSHDLARVEREFGLDWPADAETMVGRRRLDNVARCVADVLEREVPGDLLEAGVWRGGTTILMRGVLAAYGDTSRQVWVADSFVGLPKPDTGTYPADAGLDYYTSDEQLSVGVRQVQANFERYGLLDDRVRFLVGWFKDTLPSAPVEQLAVARLDGDFYESTMDALQALYPKLSVGGYLIVDDYGALEACRRAVDDYRTAHGIDEPMHPVDWTGVYWRRESA
jgi:O-methyltransferase